jgi:lactoylglutathione lyase
MDLERAGMENYMENNFQQYITGLQHIGIPTNDLEATIAFYETFGFQVAFQTVNEAAGERVAFLRLGDVTVETYENKQAALVNGALDHVALNVTDIEEVFRMAKEKRLCMLDEEVQFLPFWEKGVKFFTLTGQNKEKIEFSQYL